MSRVKSVLPIAGILIVVLAGFGALGYQMMQRFDEAARDREKLKAELAQADRSRSEMAEKLEQTRELYQLIGSDLASTDQRVSDVLDRAVAAEESSIAENRNQLQALEERVEALSTLVGEETADRKRDARNLESEMAEIRQMLRRSGETLHRLEGEVQTLGRSLKVQYEEVHAADEELRQMLEEELEEAGNRVEVVKEDLESDLVWLRGQVQRLTRRLDDMNHRFSRLETTNSREP